ncbi:MAG: YeeE/YedE thiosulfate transporter family protein [Thermodesulfobacteriota bacterium]|nr:YeeE/YedE thiosulfate transporter family protein [Thermodesulfobacteriota bacterium]
MYWNWKMGGVMLGLSFFLAVALIKPIGVSTQFVIADGIMVAAINPSFVQKDEKAKSGYSSTNAYLNKSGGKYAKSVAKPLNYSFVFVLSMFLGGLLGRLFTKNKQNNPVVLQIPVVHTRRFGNNSILRYSLSFIGGVIVLWGARLAGGCTSGHMMSGIMQTSVSGYLFAGATFIVAIPTALLIYQRREPGNE